MSVRKKKGKAAASKSTGTAQAAAVKSNGAGHADPAKSQGGAVPQQRVAERAYRLWQESGCAHGHDCEHWFQAERELGAS